MLTEEEVEGVCELIKEEVSKETDIPKIRVAAILDQEIEPETDELEKVIKVMDTIFKGFGNL